MNENLARIIGIEYVASAQGVMFRSPLDTSEMLRNAIGILRKTVPSLQEDRYLATDLEQATRIIRGRSLTGFSCLPTLDKD